MFEESLKLTFRLKLACMNKIDLGELDQDIDFSRFNRAPPSPHPRVPDDDESVHPRKRNLGVRKNVIPDLDQSLQSTDFWEINGMGEGDVQGMKDVFFLARNLTDMFLGLFYY